MPRLTSRVIAIAIATFGLMLFPAGGGLAQDATPVSPSTEAPAAHPAHIHAGSCATLGDVVYPLADVAAAVEEESSATPAATPVSAMGPSDAIVVERSVTVVDVPLADILSAEHAINVHVSADDIGTYIACGDIGGAPTGDDLLVGLAELTGSGYSGIGWLHDNGDGTTTVSIFFAQGLSGTGAGDAAATPTA